MGIEQIQIAKTKALPPASRFNWSQIGVRSRITLWRLHEKKQFVQNSAIVFLLFPSRMDMSNRLQSRDSPKTRFASEEPALGCLYAGAKRTELLA